MDSITTAIPEPDEKTDVITVELPCCGRTIDIDPLVWRNSRADERICSACLIAYNVLCITRGVLEIINHDGWKPEVMVMLIVMPEVKQ